MLFEIDLHSGVPIYRQIVDQVRLQIITGRLGAGDQLDSVRDLAARVKVNPMTVSKAYSLLEAEGLVERRRGVGLFAARIGQEQKDRNKRHILESALDKAAVVAVRLGVGEDEAYERFLKIYREYNSGKRS